MTMKKSSISSPSSRIEYLIIVPNHQTDLREPVWFWSSPASAGVRWRNKKSIRSPTENGVFQSWPTRNPSHANRCLLAGNCKILERGAEHHHLCLSISYPSNWSDRNNSIGMNSFTWFLAVHQLNLFPSLELRPSHFASNKASSRQIRNRMLSIYSCRDCITLYPVAKTP